MGREINFKLIEKLKNGTLAPILDYVKSDNELLLEVRTGGKAIIYYKKCKILEIGLNSFKIDKKYFKRKKSISLEEISDDEILKLVLNQPKSYFDKTKEIIKGWLVENNKLEFEIQQSIAYFNRDTNDKYVIIDMEYQFAQNDILEVNREKSGCYDLLGIERLTGQIVLFEVKCGLKALQGKSGIKDHINDFRKNLYGENFNQQKKIGNPNNYITFRKQLNIDIKNILKNKSELGILNFSLNNINTENVKFVFVYANKGLFTKMELEQFKIIFHKETIQFKIDYEVIFVSEEDSFKLK